MTKIRIAHVKEKHHKTLSGIWSISAFCVCMFVRARVWLDSNVLADHISPGNKMWTTNAHGLSQINIRPGRLLRV